MLIFDYNLLQAAVPWQSLNLYQLTVYELVGNSMPVLYFLNFLVGSPVLAVYANSLLAWFVSCIISPSTPLT